MPDRAPEDPTIPSEPAADPGTDAQTVAASPRSRVAKSESSRFKGLGQVASGVSSSRGPSASARPLSIGETAIAAMHDEEATRARGFGRSVAILVVLGSCAQPFFHGQTPQWLYWTMHANLAVMGLMGLYVWRVARDPIGYTRRVYRTFAMTGVVSSLIVEYYTGIYSPAPLVTTLGIAFFALSGDQRFAFGLTSVAALGYMALALGGAFGLVADVGLFHDIAASRAARLFMAAIVPAVYWITLWQARVSRRATLEAIQRSNDAIRLVRQREAQLDEANQQVDLALRAGAGQEGLYTGRMAGRYVLAEIVGRGAMGEVYAASHVDTGAPAAVKLLQAGVRENGELLQRFLREGEIAARLRAPNVVTVFEVGEMAGWAPYIAMELLSGTDLSHLLRQKRQLDLASVIELVEQIGSGLRAAHDAKIVHRDLKPQNLFLANQPDGKPPVWKILDFGVSKLQGSTGTLTQSGVIGTPGYMAPEQAQGSDCDHHADIFSLGAVAYRALTGRPPFRGSDTPQILFDIVYRMPVRPGELMPSMPGDIEMVLAIALAKHPEDRFGDVREFADAFLAASKSALPLSLRRRGATLTAAHPWGRSIAERRRSDQRAS